MKSSHAVEDSAPPKHVIPAREAVIDAKNNKMRTALVSLDDFARTNISSLEQAESVDRNRNTSGRPSDWTLNVSSVGVLFVLVLVVVVLIVLL
jgi:hypothetical protein